MLLITIPDRPGVLVREVLTPLAEAGLNIEYSYAYAAPQTHDARIVLKVNDLPRACDILAQFECPEAKPSQG